MEINKNVNAGEIAGAFQALWQLKEEKSTKEKTATLIENESNHVLKTLFYYAFNTFKQYYIKQVPQPEPAKKPVDIANYSAFIDLLEDLNERKVTDVKGRVEEFLKKCNSEEQFWYRRVLLRNLEIGITAKGVNNVYKGLIPVYDVQLAETIKDPTLTDKKVIMRLPEAFVLQYKIDGYRLNVHKEENGDVIIKTRSGLPVTGYDKMAKEARKFLPNGRVYDGEMVSPKLFAWIEQNMLRDTGEKIADRSLFKEAVSKVFSKETGKEGIFNIFDVVKKSEWESQNAKETYESRLGFLNKDVSGILLENHASQMAVVPTSRVFYRNRPEDIAEVVRIFKKFLSWGWEGLMIKNVESAYEWKRTKNLWKMKLMDTADLEVLGVTEASGEGTGMVGTLTCSYKGTVLNIGTGKMTLEERKLYFENPNLIVGKTIEVAYQAESIGKNGEPVLDFARYKKIRKDK